MAKFNIKANFKTKNVKYGGYAALITLFVVVGIVVLNVLVQQIPAELDLTERKFFSLSEQTQTVLQNLEDDVYIYAVFKTGEEDPQITAVLRKYQNASKNVIVDYVDIERNPGFAARYQEDAQTISEGSIIVESGPNVRVLSYYDLFERSRNQQGETQITGFSMEQKVTGAIQYVSSGYVPTIYQLTGHGEGTLIQYGLNQFLQGENYEIEEVNLLTGDAPVGDGVLLAISPEQDLTEQEADKLRTYIQNGGRAILLFDFYDFDREMPNFQSVLQSFGVQLINGLVMEPEPDFLYARDIPFFLAPAVQYHEITTPIRNDRANILTPYSLGIKILELRERAIDISSLIQTSDSSWVRVEDANTLNKQASAVPGPVDIAVAITKRGGYNDTAGTEPYRLIVMGNSRFLGQLPPYNTQYKSNIDFFMNSLAWVNERQESITIRSKSYFTMPLRMNALQVYIYAGIIVILIPLIILISGMVVWLKRRHL
ncbi:MAG: Gldg family protein [Spirochaetia bacterium]